VLVRGTYFRICADATLRGPDNTIAASYVKGLWQLAHRQHRSFECSGPVYLRLTNSDGRRERIGPYSFIKAADGAIFTPDGRLGRYSDRSDADVSLHRWLEIALLGV
jgi:hypothetical protein